MIYKYMNVKRRWGGRACLGDLTKKVGPFDYRQFLGVGTFEFPPTRTPSCDGS